MIELKNITSDPHQEHYIHYGDGDITLTLRFYPTVSIWCFDVTYKKKSVYGVKLSLGTLHLGSSNLPFDIVLNDTGKTGLDPYRVDDFESGRILIGLVEAHELSDIRGYEVEI